MGRRSGAAPRPRSPLQPSPPPAQPRPGPVEGVGPAPLRWGTRGCASSRNPGRARGPAVENRSERFRARSLWPGPAPGWKDSRAGTLLPRLWCKAKSYRSGFPYWRCGTRGGSTARRLVELEVVALTVLKSRNTSPVVFGGPRCELYPSALEVLDGRFEPRLRLEGYDRTTSSLRPLGLPAVKPYVEPVSV